MKNYLLLHLLYNLTPVLAWNMEGLRDWAARHFKTKSTIPQFILDANHQWISDNRSRLERYPDIGSALCTPNSSLWTGLEPPPDLFHHLEIDNNRVGIHRPGWANAVDRLREMLACPMALDEVRVLLVDIYVDDSSFSDYAEPILPPSELPALFAEALRRMPSLEYLKWGISAKATWAFEKEFTRRNLTLPSVRCLVPGKYSDYLVRMCPRLEELRAAGYFHHWSWKEYIGGMDNDAELMLIRSAAAAEGLKTLEIQLSGWKEWTPSFLKEILTYVPNITTLQMSGMLSKNKHGSYYFWDDTQWRNRGAALQKYLDILARFPRLEYLHLPSSSSLDLGFDGGAWCGNAYFGAEGREYGRQVVKADAEATEFAGKMVVKALPGLKGFSIRAVANITHGNEELPQVSWPWTGRMEEYALEQYPLWE